MNECFLTRFLSLRRIVKANPGLQKHPFDLHYAIDWLSIFCQNRDLDSRHMSAPNERAGGGFRFGNVGGEVKITAGGDVVGGNKVNIETSFAIHSGFATEQQKLQFHVQIDRLGEVLRAFRAEIEAESIIKADERERLTDEILGNLRDLKEAKESTATVPVGRPASASATSAVEKSLTRAAGIMGKLEAIAKTSAGLAEKVSEFGLKYGPLILSARHLFSLP